MGIKKIKLELTEHERKEIEWDIASILEEAADKDAHKALKDYCDHICPKNGVTCHYWDEPCDEYRSIEKEREWRMAKRHKL